MEVRWVEVSLKVDDRQVEVILVALHFRGRPEAVASGVVVTGIFSVCHKDASMLFDLGSMYSYVSLYFGSYLGMSCNYFFMFLFMCLCLLEIQFVVDRDYPLCFVTINGYDTTIDLLSLDMVDFEVIHGFNWLSP